MVAGSSPVIPTTKRTWGCGSGFFIQFTCRTPYMDYAFEQQWDRLVKKMEDRFGEPPDLTTMIFTVGLQECGQGFRKFKKDEKLEVMHVGICTLLAPMGYYEEVRQDDDGWPHFKQLQPIPAVTEQEQELLMRRALVEYFSAWIEGDEKAEKQK